MGKRLLLTVPTTLTVLLLAWAGASPAHSSAPSLARADRDREPARATERHDPAACDVCALAARLELRMTPLPEPVVHRCASHDEPLRAALPRGRVRAEDLALVEVELGLDLFDLLPDFEADPHLEVRLGASALGRIPISGASMHERAAFPQDLLASLHGLRGRITWGRHDLDRRQAQAAVWLEPPAARESARLRDVREALRAEPPWIRGLLEAQVLLDQAFDTAALRIARGLLERHGGEPHAVALQATCMRRLGLRRQDFEAEVLRPVVRARQAAGLRCDLERPPPEGLRRRTAPASCGAR